VNPKPKSKPVVPKLNWGKLPAGIKCDSWGDNAEPKTHFYSVL